MFQWYNITAGAWNRVSPIEPWRVTCWAHLLHCNVYVERSPGKCTSHLVLTPFKYRTGVLFQALIPMLNTSQTSGGKKLWILIGNPLLHPMQCPLSLWQIDYCIFHLTNVDQMFCFCLQFLTDSQVILTNNDPVWKKFEDSSWNMDFHLNLCGENQWGSSKKYNGDQLCYCFPNLDLTLECDDHILPTRKSPHTLT